MLAIRIGYGDMVSEQMGIPMSASDFEAVKKILDEGKAGNQTVMVRSLVSPVQPLSEMITGMDYGDETRRKELDFLDLRLRHMTRKEQDIFSVALKLEAPETLKAVSYTHLFHRISYLFSHCHPCIRCGFEIKYKKSIVLCNQKQKMGSRWVKGPIT